VRSLRPLLLILCLGAFTAVGVAWACAARKVYGLDRASAGRLRNPNAGEGVGFITIDRWSVGGATFLEVNVANADDASYAEYQAKPVTPPSSHPEQLARGWLRPIALPWLGGHAPWPGQYDNDMRMIDARGWPLRCLWSEYRLETDANLRVVAVPRGAITIPGKTVRKGWWSPYPVTLPCRPVWRGLLGNTAVYAVAWWGLIILPFNMRWIARRRRGRCPACGYDLKHLLDAGCPECGWNRTAP
jgi:hypothetical protein